MSRKNNAIRYIDPESGMTLSDEGDTLVGKGRAIEATEGVFSFVPDENYTSNFGFQWNKFCEIQIDKINNEQDQSTERFFAETEWKINGLLDVNILEVGSGAGRFSQVILDKTKARLFTVDYSSAVFVNYRNNGPNDRLKIFRASIYQMPFASEQFDKVLCLGVLQHTPDFQTSIRSLCDMVKPGGELVVDFYEKRGWYTKIHAKYFFRPFTRKLNEQRLLKLIERNIDWLIGVYKWLHKLGLGVLSRFVPICDIYRTLPRQLSKDKLKEWVILDTFDMFSPQYDHPQSISAVADMVKSNGMEISWADQVHFSGNTAAVVRAVKPIS